MPELKVTPEIIRSIGHTLYGKADMGIHSWKKPTRELLHIGHKRFNQYMSGELPIPRRRVAQIRRIYEILKEQERRRR